MQLICLNVWSGVLHEELLRFFRRNSECDVFCLQEVYHEAKEMMSAEEIVRYSPNIFGDIELALPNHKGYFRPSIGDYYGLAIFVRSAISVVEEGDISIFTNKQWAGGADHSRNLQYVTCIVHGKKILICNYHGLWTVTGKRDTSERVAQSHTILKFMKFRTERSKILCGDLNLLPTTWSIGLLAQSFRNLVSEFHIDSTRTRHYHGEHRFADYIFSSRDLSIERFEVMPDEVSDHAPLLLEFKIM